MADIDVVLRESLTRIAEPGDPSGVAAAIRARAASGGSGPASSGGASGPASSGPASSGPASSGPASSGGASGLAGWLPWAGAALLLGIAGGAAGALGVFGSPPAAARGIDGATDGGVVAYGCPAGSPVANLEPGQRVLATERSDDGAWLAIRDPYDLGRTVWLPAGVVVVDPGEPEPGTLPVGGCPEPAVAPSPSPSPTETAAPQPDPAPAPAPGPKPAPPPPPAPDTTQPSVSAGGWSASPVYGQTWTCGSSSSTITITASDNVGVANVSGSTSFPGASVSLQSHSGSSWVFVFQMPNANPDSTTAAVSFTAVDGAGNSRSVSAPLAVSYCLI